MPLGTASGKFYKDDEGYIYPIRNGLLEEVWELKMEINGFNTYLYIRGTEQEMREYADSELPYDYSYHGLSKNEMEEITKLHQQIYIAPKIYDNNNY